MSKDRSFAAKVAKASGGKSGNHCQQCGEAYATVQLVVSEKSAVTKSWKFNDRFVRVCKCNEAEVYG
ncbi:MAG TPA: hypothetical protein VGA99_07840 [bacterium]|jgi:hypothetical protein